MSKRIEIDGKYFRKRRGKLVEIPSEWVGICADKQTIRKRKKRRQEQKLKRRRRGGRRFFNK